VRRCVENQCWRHLTQSSPPGNGFSLARPLQTVESRGSMGGKSRGYSIPRNCCGLGSRVGRGIIANWPDGNGPGIGWRPGDWEGSTSGAGSAAWEGVHTTERCRTDSWDMCMGRRRTWRVTLRPGGMEGPPLGNENLPELPNKDSARISDVTRHSHALRQVEFEVLRMAS
jgi:hypothetical protein